MAVSADYQRVVRSRVDTAIEAAIREESRKLTRCHESAMEKGITRSGIALEMLAETYADGIRDRTRRIIGVFEEVPIDTNDSPSEVAEFLKQTVGAQIRVEDRYLGVTQQAQTMGLGDAHAAHMRPRDASRTALRELDTFIELLALKHAQSRPSLVDRIIAKSRNNPFTAGLFVVFAVVGAITTVAGAIAGVIKIANLIF